MLRELTSLSLNINNDTLVLSSVSEADLVTGGPAYKLSPSLLLGSCIQTMGELVVTHANHTRFIYVNFAFSSWLFHTSYQVALSVLEHLSIVVGLNFSIADIQIPATYIH